MAGREDYNYLTFTAQYKNPRSKDSRDRSLMHFTSWLDGQDIHVLAVSPADIIRYLDSLRERYAVSTCMTMLRSVRAYYDWLERRGMISRSPVAHIKDQPIRRKQPQSVPPEDLRRMLAATVSDRNWAILSIVAFNSLRIAELLACDVTDFERGNGAPILHFRPHADSRRRRSFVVLADESAAAIERQLDGRRTGPMFLTRDNTRLTRNGASGSAFRLTSIRAKIGYTATPEMVKNSLPAAALAHGFSMRGIVQAMGIPDHKYSEHWVKSVAGSDGDNASLRLARLVLSPPETSTNMLMHVEAAIHETDLPESFAVAGAGAIVERHLRLLCEELAIQPARDQDKGNIGYYVGELQRRGVVSVADARKFRSLGDLRNDAAHGWFDRVPAGSGPRVLRDARDLVVRYPLASHGR